MKHLICSLVRVGQKDVTPPGDEWRECKVHISVGAF